MFGSELKEVYPSWDYLYGIVVKEKMVLKEFIFDFSIVGNDERAVP